MPSTKPNVCTHRSQVGLAASSQISNSTAISYPLALVFSTPLLQHTSCQNFSPNLNASIRIALLHLVKNIRKHPIHSSHLVVARGFAWGLILPTSNSNSWQSVRYDSTALTWHLGKNVSRSMQLQVLPTRASR